MNINISFVSETADGDIRGTTWTRLCLIDISTIPLIMSTNINVCKYSYININNPIHFTLKITYNHVVLQIFLCIFAP